MKHPVVAIRLARAGARRDAQAPTPRADGVSALVGRRAGGLPPLARRSAWRHATHLPALHPCATAAGVDPRRLRLGRCLGRSGTRDRPARPRLAGQLQMILDAYLPHADSQPTAFLRTLTTNLLSLARHWVQLPARRARAAGRLATQSRDHARLPHRRDGASAARARGPGRRDALLALPAALAAQAHRGATVSRAAAATRAHRGRDRAALAHRHAPAAAGRAARRPAPHLARWAAGRAPDPRPRPADPRRRGTGVRAHRRAATPASRTTSSCLVPGRTGSGRTRRSSLTRTGAASPTPRSPTASRRRP